MVLYTHSDCKEYLFHHASTLYVDQDIPSLIPHNHICCKDKGHLRVLFVDVFLDDSVQLPYIHTGYRQILILHVYVVGVLLIHLG